MFTPQHVRVELAERSYDIEIGAGALDRLGAFAQERRKFTHAVVITDTNVEKPHAEIAAASITLSGASVDLIVAPAGEPSKSIAEAESIWRHMLETGSDRKTAVFAVGGGVVGDLAGFVAATYARGLTFFQAPTTLLADVDSSVGGKVGVNLPGAKNMVGAFWQPQGVLIDTDTLKTLPDREFRAGLAEVVKYGVILDADFFAWLEDNTEAINHREPEALAYIIARSCRLKADVVENDERETTGLRAVLNYGHTFCHAIEAVTGYGEYLHGEAVSVGMIAASHLAEQLGRIDGDLTQRQLKLLKALDLPVEIPKLDIDRLMKVMMRDKKVEHGKLRFVLPKRMGRVELVGDVPSEQVIKAWSAVSTG